MPSSQSSDSSSRFPVPTARNNSPMRSQGSTPSATPSNSRPSSSSSSQVPSSPESDRVDTLESLRVVIQDQPDPLELEYVTPTSRYFRLGALAMHLGLSMLESQGAKALIATGKSLWEGVNSRGRRAWAFQGNLTKSTESLEHFTISFLKKLRASSPSIIISDRLTGDGVTQRLDWGNKADGYNAKFAVLFHINKSHFESALTAARENDTENWEKGLLILALTVAHELVHVYYGFLTADESRNTPAKTNYPPNLTVGQMKGESGRYWEGEFIGAIIKAYYQPGDPMGVDQAGRLYLCERDNCGFELSQVWVKKCLTGTFDKPTLENKGLNSNAGKPFAITNTMKTMEQARPQHANCNSIVDNPYDLLRRINRLSSHRVDRASLASITSMVNNPRKLMAAVRPAPNVRE